ncbi:MAG: TetR/AcrR family transcriptional regulator [Devosia sp.]
MTDTKTRIVDAALALFNEQGTANVTTNHIAEALGMSPGNLYYHYRNKAEIVRALFARIEAEWAVNYEVPAGVFPSIAMMEAMMAGNFEIQWRYRFFFRDLTMLLAADPALAKTYRDHRAASFADTIALIEIFVDAGVANSPGDAEAIDDLGQLLWMVGDLWLVFKDIGGAPVGQAEMDHGVRMFRRLITPYLIGTPK